MGSRRKIDTGKRFGRLTVSGGGFRREDRKYWVECLCKCGNVLAVREDSLIDGNTRSCGCLQKDTARKNKKHGMWNSRTYSIWSGMKTRCTATNDPKAHLYAAKGIKVCLRWRDSFECFLQDMGEAPEGMSLDRINGDGDYCPENCRWATSRQQANNMSANHFVEHEGKRLTVAQWARRIGIKPNTLVYRLRRGWSVDRALNQPVQKRTHGDRSLLRIAKVSERDLADMTAEKAWSAR